MRGRRQKGCLREALHEGSGGESVRLMCPIKLLQTLPRQLFPAGPWVQIGSVSLPWGGVSGDREQWPAWPAHSRPCPALPGLGPGRPPQAFACSSTPQRKCPGSRYWGSRTPSKDEGQGWQPRDPWKHFLQEWGFCALQRDQLKESPLSGHQTHSVFSPDNNNSMIIASLVERSVCAEHFTYVPPGTACLS